MDDLGYPYSRKLHIHIYIYMKWSWLLSSSWLFVIVLMAWQIRIIPQPEIMPFGHNFRIKNYDFQRGRSEVVINFTQILLCLSHPCHKSSRDGVVCRSKCHQGSFQPLPRTVKRFTWTGKPCTVYVCTCINIYIYVYIYM